MALCGPWAQDKRGASRWERSYREGHFCRVAVTPLERDKPKELVLCRRWNKALWVSEKVWVFCNSLWDFLKFGCTEEFTWEQRHRTGAVEQRPWHSEVCKDQPLTGLLCSASQKNREHRLPGPEASKPFASKWTDSSSWNYRVWTNLWCPSQVFGLYPWSCQLKHRTVGLQTFTFFRLCLCSKVLFLSQVSPNCKWLMSCMSLKCRTEKDNLKHNPIFKSFSPSLCSVIAQWITKLFLSLCLGSFWLLII